MRAILVTTDLSDESKLAFGMAKELARKFNVPVKILAVVEDLGQVALAYALDAGFLPEMNVQKELLERVENDLRELVGAEFADIPHRYFVVQAASSVPHEIVEFAEKEGADMIVISSHGRSALSRLVLGSVTERVVREAQCPVVVVPTRKQGK